MVHSKWYFGRCLLKNLCEVDEGIEMYTYLLQITVYLQKISDSNRK